MPWAPELFSAPTLERLQEKRQEQLRSVPFWDGLMTGEIDALLGSFAGEPEVHHPVRGRIRGVRAFETYANEMQVLLGQVAVEDVERVALERHGFDEAVIHFDRSPERVGVPVAVVADKRSDRRIEELRIYFSSWPLTGRHSNRPPMLQPEPGLGESDVVAQYQAALSGGDVDAIVAAFESDGYAREPAGGPYVHRGTESLRAFYELLFSNGGGIPLEHCAVIDDQRACALEYNVVRWGTNELSPQAGMAVYVRGRTGKLAAARIYDDVDPPVSPRLPETGVPA